MAARSKAWVCGSSLAGIAGSSPASGRVALMSVSCECCQAEISVTCQYLYPQTILNVVEYNVYSASSSGCIELQMSRNVKLLQAAIYSYELP